MDYALLPPEINSVRMYAGAGSASLLAAAAGWDALGAELESAAAGCAAAVADLTGFGWSGPTATAMAAAAGPYLGWLQTSAGKAAQSALAARATAAAFEAAHAATVPPAVVATNRAVLAALVATNLLGQNTPAIAATEAQYAGMWVQDAVAMFGYVAAAVPAATLPRFDPPPQSGNPAGLSAAAAAQIHTLGQFGTAVQAALQQLAAPLGTSTTAASPLSALSTVGPALGQLSTFTGLAGSELSFDSSMYTVAANGAGWGRLLFVRSGAEGALTFEGLGPRGVLSAAHSPTARFGLAAPIGGLSVPPGWATAAAPPPVAITLVAAEAAPTPVIGTPAFGTPPGTVFSEAVLGTTAGQRPTAGTPTRRDRRGDETDTAGTDPTVGAGDWLAAVRAHHDRPRTATPLPTHWRTG